MIDLKIVMELSLGQRAGQLRSAPVSLGHGMGKAILATYCADFDVDPYCEMFYFPEDTYKMLLFTEKGEVLWKRDLGRGVVPGMWFCPILPFDLDGDGADEIWFVNNINTQHPLGISGYRLERIDAATGKTTGRWKWPCNDESQVMGDLYRNFIVGGYSKGEPVLVTVQGTYESIYLQGWNGDMSRRWETSIGKDTPGARGSHMCPVVDINNDGIDELMWGERCIELDSGKQLFCADEFYYRGHSDIIQPVLDVDANKWYLYTCRENDVKASPRVVFYNAEGKRMWGDVEQGHMDMGWVARIGKNGEKIGMSIRIGHKTCGPDGRFHHGMDEFTYNVFTGDKYILPYKLYRSIPVDLNGDGFHELVYGLPGGSGDIIDRYGNFIGNIGGTVSLVSQFTSLPGEQILAFYDDGTVRIWADQNAVNSTCFQERVSHPFYKLNQRLTSSGYNLMNLGGL